MSVLSYVPLFKLENTTIYLFVMLLYTSVLVSTNNCSVHLYNGNLPTATIFFTRNFTHGWLNSYCSSQSCTNSLTNFCVLAFSRTPSGPYCSLRTVSTLLPVYCVRIFPCAFAHLSILMLVVLFLSCLLLLVYLEQVRCIC